MQPDCRALGREDLEVGSRWCTICFRYKAKGSECKDFKYGGARLVKKLESATGKTRWKVSRKDMK